MFAYLSSCFDLSMTAPACLPFWTWFAVGAAVFAGILMLWIFWSFIHDSLKWRAALRAQARRDRIDNEAIVREKQRVEDAADSGYLSPEEIWSFIHYSLKWRAALRAQARRDRIDNEAIECEKQVGDAADSGHLSPEEIDRRIAKALAALRARKAETRSNLGAT